MTKMFKQEIETFRTQYVVPFENWSVYLPIDDLKAVAEHAESFQKRSETLSKQIKYASTDIQNQWRDLLDKSIRLCSNVLTQAARCRDESSGVIGALERGKKGLMGYKKSLGQEGSFLNSEA